jgi:nitroreductase
MKTVDGATISQQLAWRYATKKFDPKRVISPEDWKVLEGSLVSAPSSFGLQPWKFFVVTKPEIRAELQKSSWGQSQIVDASHLVVLAMKKNVGSSDVVRHIEQIAAVRKAPIASLEAYKNMMLGFITKPAAGFDVNDWAARQVYLALGMLLSNAAMMGIDACPMEGFDAPVFNRTLGLDAQGYGAVVLCTLGYRAADDGYASAPKVRYEASDIVQYL